MLLEYFVQLFICSVMFEVRSRGLVEKYENVCTYVEVNACSNWGNILCILTGASVCVSKEANLMVFA